MSGRWLAPIALVVCLCCSPLFAEDTPKIASNLHVFHFDLRTRTADDLLPFDVRFNVQAKVQANVQKGRVRYVATKCPPNPADAADLVKFSTEYSSTAVTSGSDRLLLFSIPELDPNADYCFVFDTLRRLDDDETKLFEQTVTRAIDAATSQIKPDQQVLTHEQLGKLRDDIAHAIDRTAKLTDSGLTPQPAPGSVFNTNTDAQELQTKFNEELRPILQEQRNRENAAKNFCKTMRKQIVPGINAQFGPNGATRTFLAALQKDKDSNPALLKAIGDHDESLERLVKADFDFLDDSRCELDQDGVPAVGRLDTPDIQSLNLIINTLRLDFRDTQEIVGRLIDDKVNGVDLDQARIALPVLRNISGELAAAVAQLDKTDRALAARPKAIATMVSDAGAEVQDTVPILSTSTGDFTTRHGFYVTMDVGVAAGLDIKQAFTYAGMNVYTRPINKDAPLRLRDSWRRRTSFTFGVTLQDVKQDNAFSGVLADRAFVAGVGIRILDSVKLTGGGLVVKERDRNPLVSRTRLALTPFVAFSIDWDVRSSLKSLGTALGIP